MPNRLAGAVVFAPAGVGGGGLREPVVEFFGRHVDYVVELPDRSYQC